MNDPKEKGKGKLEAEKDIPGGDAPKIEDEQPEMSLLSRIGASATGLARDVFAVPNGNTLKEGTASLMAGKGQGQTQAGSSSSAPAWDENLPWDVKLRGSGTSTGGLRGSGPEGIGEGERHIRRNEQEFSGFLDGIPSFESSAPLQSEQSIEESAWEKARLQSGQTSTSSQTTPRFRYGYNTIQEQQRHDGEGVLALLSTPNPEGLTFEDEIATGGEGEEKYDWGLSSEQILQIRSITKDLFLFPELEPHQKIDPENPLNLIPDHEPQIFYKSQAEEKEVIYAGVPFNVKIEGKEGREWKSDWEGVLNGYTDEVWGGLLPLVKDARRELDEGKEGVGRDQDGREKPRALRRLGAVLGHLRGAGR